MRKLLDPNSTCESCGGYELGARCESCGVGKLVDFFGRERSWSNQPLNIDFGEGVVEGLAKIGIDAEKEVRRGIIKSRINELRLDAGIAKIENQQWLCVVDKETGMLVDPMIGLEKFAELIVKECVAICQDIDGEDNIDARSGRQDCAVEIKEYFGVKE